MNDIIDRVVEAARKDCCAKYRKPCPYHDGYADGAEALLNQIKGMADYLIEEIHEQSD